MQFSFDTLRSCSVKGIRFLFVFITGAFALCIIPDIADIKARPVSKWVKEGPVKYASISCCRWDLEELQKDQLLACGISTGPPGIDLTRRAPSTSPYSVGDGLEQINYCEIPGPAQIQRETRGLECASGHLTYYTAYNVLQLRRPFLYPNQ